MLGFEWFEGCTLWRPVTCIRRTGGRSVWRGRAACPGLVSGRNVASMAQRAICASSKPSDDLSSSLFLRFDFEWSNFATAITDGGILKAIVNSVIITLCSTVITCLVGAAAAYPLARRQTRGNKLVSAGILAITGAGGAFGANLQKLPIADALSASLLGLGVGVFLPFIIAALLKTAMGASTVAMITTSAMIAPLMPALGFTTPLAKVLVIMAIGAGSMTVSHANDSYFWVVSQFSDMETKDAYKCQTGMTGVMGIVTIIVVFLLSLVFVH